MTVLPVATPRPGPAADPGDAEPPASPPSPDEATIARRAAAFDARMRLRAEQQREANALRDMRLQQRRVDDEYLKRCIEMIA